MDLLPTSKLRFLSVDGHAIIAPLEWQPALIEVQVPIEQRHTVQLSLQGQPLAIYLKSVAGQERILANWDSANPGHYHLRLTFAELIEEQTITVQSRKISPAALAQLLEDLETQLPVTVAIALQQMGAQAGVQFLPFHETTLAEEVNRLRRAIAGTRDRPGLAQILQELARDPHQVLKTEAVWVPQARVRRPITSQLAQAFCQGHNLNDQGQPIRVVDQRVEPTVNVYENQLVKSFIHQVNLRLRRLEHRLSLLSNHAINGSYRLLQEVSKLSQTLIAAQRQATFLREVSLLNHLPHQLSMVFLKRSPYYAALEGYLEFYRRTSIRLEEPAGSVLDLWK